MFKIQKDDSDQFRKIEIEDTIVTIPIEHANTVAAAPDLYNACLVARGLILAVLSCNNAIENHQMLKAARDVIEDALDKVEELTLNGIDETISPDPQ